tara:strand:- start:13 stop:429 length:417 start_codon:yes stop_codon:yes gene_type:complete
MFWKNALLGLTLASVSGDTAEREVSFFLELKPLKPLKPFLMGDLGTLATLFHPEGVLWALSENPVFTLAFSLSPSLAKACLPFFPLLPFAERIFRSLSCSTIVSLLKDYSNGLFAYSEPLVRENLQGYFDIFPNISNS